MTEGATSLQPFQTASEVNRALLEMRNRESAMSRLLMAFISTGVIFMLFPGTLLGVWNLLQISGKEHGGAISASWVQAHGHAQVFGWIGSFLLGIGFYSIPKLRDSATRAIRAAWVCWVLWTSGVFLRWASTIYLYEWRLMIPLGGALELAASLIFFSVVSGHRAKGNPKSGIEPWVWVVMSATIGFLAVLVFNLVESIRVARLSDDPAFPHNFDQRYLALLGWGFLVPFVWGFSAKWMRVFLGLKPLRPEYLMAAVAVNLLGVGFAFAGWFPLAAAFLLVAACVSAIAFRIFEPSVQDQ